MSKKRAIVSYEKLTIEQKKQILKDFPDGYSNHLTTSKNPITGESFESFVWETEEIIYLVKITKAQVKPPRPVADEDEDDDFNDEDLESVDGIEDEDVSSDDEEEDEYDKPDADAGDEEDA
ncbi:MAG: hypothetical protein V4638_09140 [Bacteroidota bacterium]